MNDVVVIHHDNRRLMELTKALSDMRYQITAVDSIRPIATARRMAERHPPAMIVSLDGSENVAEMREVVSAAPETRFVFLAAEMPPRAALARLVNERGSTILAEEESPMVIAATLVALLAPLSRDAV